MKAFLKSIFIDRFSMFDLVCIVSAIQLIDPETPESILVFLIVIAVTGAISVISQALLETEEK